jgi:acetyl-CoA carboxylase biotin carboxyl carrier protein
MDKKAIKEYIELLEESNLSSLRIKTDKGELHIQKEPARELALPVTAHRTEPTKIVEKKPTINAPMVATFYRASSPKDKPFVSVGKKVELGDVLCILEAMKVMNEITAEKSGVIKEILVDDGMSVEYDQPLFVVE